MCGRFSFSTSKEKLKKQLGDIVIEEELEANYNVAPTQKVYVITNEQPNTLQQMTWGLVPSWSKEGKPSGRMINARSETIASKPSFRVPFRKRRCLVIADSFYEWRREGKQKLPFRILPKDDSLLVMAGIWERWYGEQQHILETCSILTTDPNQEMQPIHNRMPLILTQKAQYHQWLKDQTPAELLEFIHIPPDDILNIYPVSTAVNSVRNNGPHLHEKIE
ncbi:MAG: SOS response-associated peptidase [Bacteroidota bacterium]